MTAEGVRPRGRPDNVLELRGEIALVRSDLKGHERRDDDRFATLNGSLEEVKQDVRDLKAQVSSVADDVSFMRGQMDKQAGTGGGAPPEEPSAWHVGGNAMWLIAAVMIPLLIGLAGVTAQLAQTHEAAPAAALSHR